MVGANSNPNSGLQGLALGFNSNLNPGSGVGANSIPTGVRVGVEPQPQPQVQRLRLTPTPTLEESSRKTRMDVAKENETTQTLHPRSTKKLLLTQKKESPTNRTILLEEAAVVWFVSSVRCHVGCVLTDKLHRKDSEEPTKLTKLTTLFRPSGKKQRLVCMPDRSTVSGSGRQ